MQLSRLYFSILLLHVVIIGSYGRVGAQVDSLPRSKWLSDSLFTETDSLAPPPPHDSLKPPPILPPQKVPVFGKVETWRVVGIRPLKTEKLILAEIKKVEDSLSLRKKSEEWASYLKSKGFLEANFEGFSLDKQNLTTFFHQGNWYGLSDIRLHDIPKSYLSKNHWDKSFRKIKIYEPEKIESSLTKILLDYRNMGYPFARFEMENIEYKKKGKDSLGVEVDYLFDAGKKYTIDSIIIIGNPRERKSFIESLTRVGVGDTYNQSYIDGIPRILNSSIYYKAVKLLPTQYDIYGRAKLRIQLQRKQANKFDALIGILQPPNTSTTPDKRVQFTASLDIRLVSVLRYGETLQFKYDKLPNASSKMFVKLQMPYILRLPLHLNGELELFKQANDFLNRHIKGGAEYSLSPFFSAFLQVKTRVTSLDTSYVKAVVRGTRRPTILDGNQQVYLGGIHFENLDYKFNPKKGWQCQLEIGFGRQTVKRNIGLPYTIYDTLALARIDSFHWSQPMREVDITLKWYKQLSTRQVIHLANRSYWLDQKKVFQNDQMQIGGSRSLRGFNENQFFVNRFTFFTAEYRFILEQNTFLFAFCDYGWLRDNVQNTSYRPLGVGLGLTYDTPVGIVSFSYAIGKAGDIPFQPGRGKIHFGLVNQF